MKKTAYKILTKSISKILKTPPYVILYLSDKCWLHCKHCFFVNGLKQKHKYNNTLSFDELEKMSQNMSRIHYLSLTGGEAFLREELVDIVSLFHINNKVGILQIPTSGYNTELITNKVLNILTKIKIPFRVDVSLDGTNNIHNRIRNNDNSFKNAINTIKELKSIKNHYTNFDTSVITTLSSYNQEYITEISNLIEKVLPNGEWKVNISRGNKRKDRSTDINIDNYRQISDIINNRIKNGSYKGLSGHKSAKWLSAKNSVRRRTIEKILLNKYNGGGCSAGTLGAVIFHDGYVSPCEMFDEDFGNIRDFNYNFKKLWTSGNANRIRDKIQNEYCFCTQECFWTVNLLIHPSKWPLIFKERIRLLLYQN